MSEHEESLSRRETCHECREAWPCTFDRMRADLAAAVARAAALEAERDQYKAALVAAKAFDDHRLTCRDDICFERADLWHKQRELTVAALAGQPAGLED